MLARGLAKIAGAGGAGDVSVAVAGTIVKLLLVQGFIPDLAGCVSCGTAEGLAGFGAEEGGILCARCLETAAVGCFAVTDEGICCLRDLVACPLADLDPNQMGESGLREAERMVHRLRRLHRLATLVVGSFLGDGDIVRVLSMRPAEEMRTKRAWRRRSSMVAHPVYPMPARKPPTI